MAEPVLNPTSGATSEPAEDPWHVAFLEFKTRDEKMVKEYQEEIDTLLVFAGLLSAVLTAFVVESYQSLQEDHTQTTVDLLRQISRQLANPSSPAAPEPAQFQAQRSDVQVNVCWFVSLLLSLFVALFGIFLKQWMRAYMKWTDVKPDREAVALRQFRYRGLESWRPGAILTLLPTLLQLSLILFLSGLLVFLWNIDLMVAHVMAGLSAIAFFLVALVTVLPVFARSCSYRSPLSEVLALSLWRAMKIVGSAIQVSIRSGFTYAPNTSRWQALTSRWRKRSKNPLPASWVQADEGAIDRYNHNNDRASMDLRAMVHLCCTTQSQPLWSAAITAITTTVTSRTTDAFYKEVWWPVFEHITLFHENKRDSQLGYTQLFQRTSSQFTHFSSSMKHCWVNFVLQLKSFACQSKSSRVVESYLLCCIASMESTTGGPCGLVLMEVLKARHRTLEKHRLDSIASSLSIHASTRTSPTTRNPKSGAKFIQDLQQLCSPLRDIPKTTRSGKYRQLLDILTQLACQAALAVEPEPSDHVPENLRNLLTALKPVYDNSPPYPASHIVRSCSSALISVARKETDLFPKPLARAMVRQIDPQRLLDAVKDVDGLDLKGVNVHSKWDRLDARSLAAIETLISPGPFARILNAYADSDFSIHREPSAFIASRFISGFAAVAVDDSV